MFGKNWMWILLSVVWIIAFVVTFAFADGSVDVASSFFVCGFLLNMLCLVVVLLFFFGLWLENIYIWILLNVYVMIVGFFSVILTFLFEFFVRLFFCGTFWNNVKWVNCFVFFILLIICGYWFVIRFIILIFKCEV